MSKKEVVTEEMLCAAFDAIWGDHWRREASEIIKDYGPEYRKAIEAAIRIQHKLKQSERSRLKKEYWAKKSDAERKAFGAMLAQKRKEKQNENQ